METDFRNNRYQPQKNSLKNLCSQLGISTSVIPPIRTTTTQTTRPYSSNRPSSKSDSNSGCLIWILVWIVVSIISCVIINANGGDGSGSFLAVGAILSIVYRLVRVFNNL